MAHLTARYLISDVTRSIMESVIDARMVMELEKNHTNILANTRISAMTIELSDAITTKCEYFCSSDTIYAFPMPSGILPSSYRITV